jgi:ankyrin repeat protein
MITAKPLLVATKNGHEAVVKLLLEAGKVDLESRDPFRGTPLMRIIFDKSST